MIFTPHAAGFRIGAFKAVIALAASVAFAAPAFAQDANGSGATVTVATDQGERTVPKNPETLVVYDLAAMDTLDALGVEIDGVPTAPYPQRLAKFAGEETAKVGTLFEPDFEAVNALAPDLIVTGARSRGQTEALSAIAPTIDVSVDPENYIASAIERVRALATIFDKSEAADEKIARLESDIETLNSEAANAGKGLILLTTGNRISAFGPGSRFGVLHSAFGIEPADQGLATGNHGEAVSYEYIATINPDWLFVIDRDAAIGQGSAASLLDNDLVRGTTAWTKGQVVYLDPANWYLAGSGLQAMQNSVDQIREALEKSGS